MSDDNQLATIIPQQTTTFRISGDVVNRATSGLPDTQRSAIRRLHAHYIENDLTLDEAGKLIPIDLKKGDRVLFGKWSGTEVKIDGQDLLIMKESDIMGVLG